MSCPYRCSNDFKVKNIPDEIECVVADKIVTSDPSGTIVDIQSFAGLPRLVTGTNAIGASANAVTEAKSAGILKEGDLFIAVADSSLVKVGIVQIVQ